MEDLDKCIDRYLTAVDNYNDYCDYLRKKWNNHSDQQSHQFLTKKQEK